MHILSREQPMRFNLPGYLCLPGIALGSQDQASAVCLYPDKSSQPKLEF